MPQALALALFNLGAPLAVSNAIVGVGIGGSILSFATSIAISVGLSYLANILLRPAQPKPSDGSQEFQQPIPPRVFIYGRMMVAGPLSFFEHTVGAVDVDNRDLFRHILISAREIDAYEKYYLDDVEIIEDGFGDWIGGSFSGLVFIYPHLGTDAQTVDAETLARFPTIWSSAHRLRGIAYVCARYNSGGNPTDFQTTYSSGIPSFRTLIRGAKIYDPRLDSTVTGGSGSHRFADKSTWQWSDNSALIVLDYLTHSDGYNRPIGQIVLPSFMTLADICDELVPLKAGGTVKRYLTAAAVSLAEPRTQVLERLLEACDATLQSTASGAWKIVGGEWIEPTVTLDAALGHILEAEFAGGMSAMERYNELAIQYLSPDHDYVEVEGDPWQNTADITDTGVIETRPFDVMQVPRHGQARRLAKIRMARDNPLWVGSISTNYYGLDANGERCIRVKWAELGIDLPFWIESFEQKGDGTGANIRIRSADAASYNWDAVTEEGTPPPVPEKVEDF